MDGVNIVNLFVVSNVSGLRRAALSWRGYVVYLRLDCETWGSFCNQNICLKLWGPHLKRGGIDTDFGGGFLEREDLRLGKIWQGNDLA